MKQYFMLLIALVAINTQACSDAGDHVQLRECLEKKAKLSSKQLKETENRILLLLNNSDEDEDYKLKTKLLFKKSQQAYIKYRQEQCSFDKSLASGGNGARDMELACLIELNDTRKIKISNMFQLQ